MKKNFVILVIAVLFLFPRGIRSQEIKIFAVEDFDLKGKVKTCLVSTNYGKEEYDFNEEGLLTKSVTRYNDADYEITYYKYSKSYLIEKRFENYRDNKFQSGSSIANFYSIDSTSSLKITEKIMSYNKDFLDQYEYYFKADTLSKVVRSNYAGTDETLVLYAVDENMKTKSFVLNGVTQKTTQTTAIIKNTTLEGHKIRNQKYFEGRPNVAIEEVFDVDNKIRSKAWFYFDVTTDEFIKEKTELYTYDTSEILSKVRTISDSYDEVRDYTYFFDTNKNWVKEIITPDNTYTSRKITYYEPLAVEVQSE